MTTPKPTPEQNLPPAPDSEETRPDSVDKTGFFNRVQRDLKQPKPHPTQEQEIVVELVPIKKTDSDEQT